MKGGGVCSKRRNEILSALPLYEGKEEEEDGGEIPQVI